jgi:hypothetical protein
MLYRVSAAIWTLCHKAVPSWRLWSQTAVEHYGASFLGFVTERRELPYEHPVESANAEWEAHEQRTATPTGRSDYLA